jgi:hypothetical protein
MNVREINPGTLGTLWQYVSIVIPLTVVSVWGVVAFQFDPRRGDPSNREKISVTQRTLERIGWPVMLVRELIQKRKVARN